MIFVTVGSQLPFDRLIQAMDAWAAKHPDIPVFAQIGDSCVLPEHMEFAKKLSPDEYSQRFLGARLVVSHCGMGTIITGLENALPLVLMPRRFKLGEHRNDHQLRTAERFAHFELIDIVQSADAMEAVIQRHLDADTREDRQVPDLQPSPRLLAHLRSFIDTAKNDD